MRQFQIFRYLKKWRYLIAAIMAVGGFLFYTYVSNQQTYTAYVAIRYTNAEASQGLLPGGSKLDVSDILSSRVINSVISDLDMNASVEGIRSRCDIDEVIPEDEETRKEALLDLGKEYFYFPTDYILSYTVDATSMGRESARRVVSSILDNYFRVYADKYISKSVPANNTANLVGSGYDYIEQIDLISQNMTDTIAFLSERADLYPNYRSAKTGYSFADLEAIYQYIYDNTLPYLYARTIDSGASKNVRVLARKYEQAIANYDLEYDNNEEQLVFLDRVIEEYAAKLAESIAAQGKTGGIDNSGKAVLMSVYDDWRQDGVVDRSITYDVLINRRINYQLQMDLMEITKNRDSGLLGVFSAASNNLDKRLDSEIEELVASLSGTYDTLSTTYDEFNSYMTAQNLAVTTNINTSASINVELYLALAIVVFFVFGCCGAIVLGRGQDIMEYIIYNDQKTGLPNRAMCDREIAKYDNVVLPDDFCCALVCLDNLRVTNDTKGYASGNTMLRQLSLILQEAAHDLGFIGYNNSGQYLCLFDDCTEARAESMKERLLEMVNRYNENSKDEQLKVLVSYKTTTESKLYDIKKLLRVVSQSLFAK